MRVITLGEMIYRMYLIARYCAPMVLFGFLNTFKVVYAR